VLVHGGGLGGREAWIAQKPLTARWRLLAPDRPGHGRSPDARQDFERDAGLVADQLLDRPVHLVGHSYGAIVSMLAAVRRPHNVRSLVVVEPPAWGVLPDHVAAAAHDRRFRALAHHADDPRVLLAEFFDLAGVPVPVPDPLPEPLERGARALANARAPGEAELPLAELAAEPFPILTLSGGHSPEFEAVCDAIARETGAQREVMEGMRHLVPSLGEPFNTRLERFWAGSAAG
jgi:pimeloyl-ACP methyl ester carboxylesterase